MGNLPMGRVPTTSNGTPFEQARAQAFPPFLPPRTKRDAPHDPARNPHRRVTIKLAMSRLPLQAIALRRTFVVTALAFLVAFAVTMKIVFPHCIGQPWAAGHWLA